MQQHKGTFGSQGPQEHPSPARIHPEAPFTHRAPVRTSDMEKPTQTPSIPVAAEPRGCPSPPSLPKGEGTATAAPSHALTHGHPHTGGHCQETPVGNRPGTRLGPASLLERQRLCPRQGLTRHGGTSVRLQVSSQASSEVRGDRMEPGTPRARLLPSSSPPALASRGRQPGRGGLTAQPWGAPRQRPR